MGSENSDQTDLGLRWAHMPFCWFCHAAAHKLEYDSCFNETCMKKDRLHNLHVHQFIPNFGMSFLTKNHIHLDEKMIFCFNTVIRLK